MTAAERQMTYLLVGMTVLVIAALLLADPASLVTVMVMPAVILLLLDLVERSARGPCRRVGAGFHCGVLDRRRIPPPRVHRQKP